MTDLANHPGFWLRDDAAKAFDAWEAKYGKRKLNSAGRSKSSQQELINRWHKGGPANRPPYLYRPAEPAETSPHVIDGGIAVDLADWQEAKKTSEEFGFHWYGDGDVVHFNFRGWDGNSSKRGGYQDGTVELKRFQEKLIRMGHDLGPTGADAVFGPRTKAATLHEQGMAEKNGYPGGAVSDDGLPGPQTEAYLDWWLVGRHAARPSSKSAGELTYADIQAALRRHGYDLVVDNIWGPKSSAALADFQRKNGLKVDRLVGPLTWDKLNR
ncbi:lysin A [Microbacterium phage Martin]|uniref:Lysin A n=14 Tax=Ilzatvirus teagan TaxID=2845595 RepID=A0A2L0HMU4_9CAUD|nr:endolysin [Microbacterium phage Teagan]AUX83048.1 lysin A [Microbacterium phage Ludgate]AVR56046.1 lysin A [Microbacterium phage Bandik]AVR56353.1 lysin A [Microbacterium phage Nagem]AWN03479.1 lysin A [Microbacterium phage Gargoyle]AWN03739.1 lysin A [Microbacterium phage Martin]QBZ73132.1 lysin A [Microbacterium phage TinSulphur]QDH47778.1 lysin A [Microbacterium phage Shee]QDP44696.1 lysin A [Microbacterium phage Stanktossa]QJD51009.1 lysin A [Microbacterium phage Pherferi]QKN87842.